MYRKSCVKNEFLISYVRNLAFKNIDNFSKPLLGAYAMACCVLMLSLCIHNL